MYPNTRAVVICDTMTFGFEEAQINDIGFAHDSQNHGISYVETGPGAYVTLYTGNDYQGDSLVIGPSQKVWLEQVRINGGSRLWNDQVESVYFQSHQGEVATVQTSGIFKKNVPPTADHCVSV